jgi:hypothetical protein
LTIYFVLSGILSRSASSKTEGAIMKEKLEIPFPISSDRIRNGAGVSFNA